MKMKTPNGPLRIAIAQDGASVFRRWTALPGADRQALLPVTPPL